MKNIIKYVFLGLCILITILSCTKEISIDIPKRKPQLVIESTLVPYSSNSKSLGVKVTSTRSIFNSSTVEPITDAIVLLYKNGVFMDTLVYDSSNYAKFYPCGFGPMQGPLAGEVYRIKVSSEGFNSVEAETVIPEKVSIEDVSINRIGFFDDSGLVYSNLKIIFTDPPEKENYYEIVVTTIGNEYKTENYHSLTSHEPFIVSEPHYPDVTRIDLKNPIRLLFNDKTFSDQRIELDCYYFANQIIGGEHILTSVILAVQLRNVSKEYYLFQTTLLHSCYNSEADILYGLGEPLNVISNITNGHGIFAGFNNDIHYISLDTLTVRR